MSHAGWQAVGRMAAAQRRAARALPEPPTEQRETCPVPVQPRPRDNALARLTSASTAIHDMMSTAVCRDLNAVSKGVPATAPVAAAASLNQSPPGCRCPAVDSC